jgi:hypothetical protein
MNADSGVIIFSGNGSVCTPTMKAIPVADGWRQFLFNLESSEGSDREYFDRIWDECLPVLKRYQESSSSRSKLARASMMSRNFSHNVGSHALANPWIYKSLGIGSMRTATTRLAGFHNYTQGRLDFMARTMSGTSERPEPLFFVSDVLNGFFRQGVLLDALLRDRDYPASNLRFKVEIRTGADSVSKATFVWDQNGHRFTASQDDLLEDVLVGIPDGNVACHALYAFLENALRNAAKYGRDLSEDRTLELFIRLEKCKALRSTKEATGPCEMEDAWILRITDNVSRDEDWGVTSHIREFINASLISEAEDGQFALRGHGIQEMKVCAEILSGGDRGLRFPVDTDHTAGKCGERCTACAEYQEYIHRAKGRVPSINLRQALRCYSCKVGGEHFLTYCLLLPCPTLLGIVTLGAPQLTQTPPSPPDFVRRFPDIESLANSGAHLGLIWDSGVESDSDDIVETLTKVAQIHPALPFRLILVSPRSLAWLKILSSHASPGFARQINMPFQCGRHIPANRLRVVSASDQDVETLGLSAFLLGNSAPSSFRYLGAEGWEAIVLRVYDLWLRSYKPLPDKTSPWKLCIGFKRDADQIFGSDNGSAWGSRVEDWGMSETDISSISLYVNTIQKARNSANWPLSDKNEAKDPSEVSRSEMIAFDNHGQLGGHFVNSWLKDGPLFHQEVSLDSSLNLYQAIENPPYTNFGFAFFIYSLVEAALTRVAVVDERVAQASIVHEKLICSVRENPQAGGDLVFQKAGVFPLYSFKREGESWSLEQLRADCGFNQSYRLTNQPCLPYGFLSRTIAMAAYRVSWDDFKKKWRDNYAYVWKDEGLLLGADICKAQYVYRTEGGAAVADVEADLLVLHEGITDVLQDGRRWNAKDVDRLYECAPSVIRTSGRGQDSRHLQPFLPFVEFNDVSGNIYGSLNKLALTKSLLGTTGYVIPDEGVS